MTVQSKQRGGINLILLILLSGLSASQATASEFNDSQFIAQELERAKSNPDNSTTLNVAQPIDIVFDALLTKLADYSENIENISFDHRARVNSQGLGVGSLRITTLEDGTQLVQRIIVFDPPRSFAYFTDLSLSTVRVPIDYSIGYYSFNELQNGLVSAKVSVVYRPSSRLTSFLVKIGFNRALSRDFEKAEEYLNALPPQE
jgi:hypothetical protein